jgi:hypothetical protein
MLAVVITISRVYNVRNAFHFEVEVCTAKNIYSDFGL